MSLNTQNLFIESVKKIENKLNELNLYHSSTIKKGFATYIAYETLTKTKVEFIYGPADWAIDIVLSKDDKVYGFKDLLKIPVVFQWANGNKINYGKNSKLDDELTWFVNLLCMIFKTHALP